jgi:hypothetical protein
MRFSGRRASAIMAVAALGTILTVVPVLGTQPAGAASTPAAPVPAGTLVICTGSIGMFVETSTLPDSTDLLGINGDLNCTSPSGQSFPAEVSSYTYSGTDGLRQCLGNNWLPGPFPGSGGGGLNFEMALGNGNPLVLPAWNMTWAAPPVLRGLPDLPVIGTASPVTTGLLYSKSGAQLGAATVVWTPSEPNFCDITPVSSDTSANGSIVIALNAPTATAFTQTP